MTKAMGETDIVKALERMCAKDNSQDQKMLLLAELVTQKFNGIDHKQKELYDKLHETNIKLDDIARRFDGVDKRGIGYLSLLSQHPKLIKFVIALVTLLILSGAVEGVSNLVLKLF